MTEDMPCIASRLQTLRSQLQLLDCHACLVPVADYCRSFPLAPCERRLEWLSGFSGSAGMGAVSTTKAALFVDGRYTIQARMQMRSTSFKILDFRLTRIRKWLKNHVPSNGAIAIDARLHSDKDIKDLKSGLGKRKIVYIDQLIDNIWHDQPPSPRSAIFAHDVEYAGESRESKIDKLVHFQIRKGLDSLVLNDCASIAWLLNIRGSDIPHTPIKHALATVSRHGLVTLCVNLPKDTAAPDWLGQQVVVRPFDEFDAHIAELSGRVFVADTARHRIIRQLRKTGAKLCRGSDPCEMLKAIKNPVQVAGFRNAHLRDGVALAEFLAWLDERIAAGKLSESEAALQLLEFRGKSVWFRESSFETISATGSNGAIIHYRVVPDTERKLSDGDLYLVDSGGQYRDGTTDVTRTLPVGTVSPDHVRSYTLVLRGLIALWTAKWPDKSEGRAIDALARQFLWREQCDYAHGTGHGVGHFLSVHEGPANISRLSNIPLKKGMVLSVEPGFYASGEYGIRLENLAVVEACQPARDGQDREFLQFSNLTVVPFDRRLIDHSLLSSEELRWLNDYHAKTRTSLNSQCSPRAQKWLQWACAPLKT